MTRTHLIPGVMLLWLAAGASSQERFQLQTSKPGLPGVWEVELINKPGPAASSNQEIIDLLRKVIQKLETPTAEPMKVAPAAGAPDADKVRGELEKRLHQLHFQLGKQAVIEMQLDGKETPEMAQARAEVQAAEKQLAAAKARLAKMQPGQSAPAGQPFVIRAHLQAAPKASDAELEQRLDRLMRDLEELRREIKSRQK